MESELLHTECTGLSIIKESKRAQVLNLVKQILPTPGMVKGYTTLTTHYIDVGNVPPVKHAHWHMSPMMLETARIEVERLSGAGVIEPSVSE